MILVAAQILCTLSAGFFASQVFEFLKIHKSKNIVCDQSPVVAQHEQIEIQQPTPSMGEQVEKQEYEEIALANIGGGAAPELFKRELDEVLKNIADLNTSAKTKRSITLQLTIHPTENRDMGEVTLEVFSKLARVKPAAATMYFQKKGSTIKAFHHNINQPDLPFGNVTELKGGGNA